MAESNANSSSSAVDLLDLMGEATVDAVISTSIPDTEKSTASENILDFTAEEVITVMETNDIPMEVGRDGNVNEAALLEFALPAEGKPLGTNGTGINAIDTQAVDLLQLDGTKTNSISSSPLTSTSASTNVQSETSQAMSQESGPPTDVPNIEAVDLLSNVQEKSGDLVPQLSTSVTNATAKTVETPLEAPIDNLLSNMSEASTSIIRNGDKHTKDTEILLEEKVEPVTSSPTKGVGELDPKLAEAHKLIAELQRQLEDERNGKKNGKASDDVLEALQSNLEQQMNLKAEAENRARLSESKIKELEELTKSQTEQLQQMTALQENLQLQMNAKAEAENKARLALERIEALEDERDQHSGDSSKLCQLEEKAASQGKALTDAQNETEAALERIKILEKEREKNLVEKERLLNELSEVKLTLSQQEREVLKIREERDEQHRKETALTSRLNAAKMKEADKANLAEQYEDEIKSLEQDLESVKKDFSEEHSKREKLESELETLKRDSKERLLASERSLSEERTLNEERKRKMKAFVETKAEELMQAKTENESLQAEASQTNKSLVELNNRWKQLHAQYVQSQTRNRELQRELNRFKKDSENLHKVGDSLEMKLSRSANETEEHKNKRIAAKHELMTVLRTLETEREITSKLHDTIKFTFTPKALSQQRLLQEAMDDFEAQLQKLSLRLGKPLPPSNTDPLMVEPSDHSDHDDDARPSDAPKSHDDITRLIAKLERETQAVSQSILVMTENIERMHIVLDASGDRSCYTVLSEILLSGGTSTASPAIQSHGEDSEAGTRQRRRVPVVSSSHRYGTVPAADS